MARLGRSWCRCLLGISLAVEGGPLSQTKGLVPLFENCEDLKELRIVLDATVVDHNSFEKPGQGISNRKLKPFIWVTPE